MDNLLTTQLEETLIENKTVDKKLAPPPEVPERVLSVATEDEKKEILQDAAQKAAPKVSLDCFPFCFMSS